LRTLGVPTQMPNCGTTSFTLSRSARDFGAKVFAFLGFSGALGFFW
jgi:hypothetical protein